MTCPATRDIFSFPIAMLMILSLGIVVSYTRIFVFWMHTYFAEQKRDRNEKLFDLALVFLLCAFCGHGLSLVMFYWPG